MGIFFVWLHLFIEPLKLITQFIEGLTMHERPPPKGKGLLFLRIGIIVKLMLFFIVFQVV